MQFYLHFEPTKFVYQKITHHLPSLNDLVGQFQWRKQLVIALAFAKIWRCISVSGLLSTTKLSQSPKVIRI